MNIKILRDNNNNAIGWSITGETEEEKLIVNTIRNLQFFRFNDTAIEYAGRHNDEPQDKNAGTLSWKQSKHIKH